jgi:hypothetical protein
MCWSPNGIYIACVLNKNQLYIIDIEKNSTYREYNLPYIIPLKKFVFLANFLVEAQYLC